MKIAIHLAHPAHYHLFKNVIHALSDKHEVVVTYNNKDILEQLIQGRDLGTISVNIKSKKRLRGSLGLLLQFLEKEINLIRVIRRQKPDIILGTSIIVAHTGWLLNIPSVIINEDDFDVVVGTAKIGYPFCSQILAPACCRTGKWAHKVVAYESYHELAYLGPRYFRPDPARIAHLRPDAIPFFILRFADLSAHHDFGKSGINKQVARRLIELLAPHGRIYITAERALEPLFEEYRIQLDPLDIHHALFYADLYIGDSQTMAAEAAVLGTPSIRFNDFVGRISYLDELEQYGLTYGIESAYPERLYAKITELLRTTDRKERWVQRRTAMLRDKIDLAAFMVWFIENYPQSAQKTSTNQQIHDKFRFGDTATQSKQV